MLHLLTVAIVVAVLCTITFNERKNTVSKVLTLSLPRLRVIDMSIVLTNETNGALSKPSIYLLNILLETF